MAQPERPDEKSSRAAAEKSPAKARHPEDRQVEPKRKKQVREKMLDKTLADSFPTSDPPSSIPDPGEDDSFAA